VGSRNRESRVPYSRGETIKSRDSYQVSDLFHLAVSNLLSCIVGRDGEVEVEVFRCGV